MGAKGPLPNIADAPVAGSRRRISDHLRRLVRPWTVASGPVLTREPGLDQAGRWAFHHAAISRGGARDCGFFPLWKTSMMRMGPPQHGHGSRSVSGVGSAAGSRASPGAPPGAGRGPSRCWSCVPNWRAGRSAGCGGSRRASMDQKPADELVGGQPHDPSRSPVLMGWSFPAEGDDFGVCTDQAGV